MIRKINLYIDSIKRMPLKQNYFLIKEKLINKITPVKISNFSEIERKTDLTKIKSTLLSKVENISLNNNSLFDAGIKQDGFQNKYLVRLNEVLGNYFEKNDLNSLINFWNKKEHDIEMLYNFQRMYGFPEYVSEKNISSGKIVNLLSAWIDNYPPERNAAWTGFNCAIRVINWVKMFSKFTSEEIQNLDEKIILSILQQTEFIEKNIEHHIPGNHVIFQFFTIWLVGYLFEISELEKYGREFENEFQNEYLNDGLHFELSTHYHIQVLLLGIYYYLINQKYAGVEFFQKISQAVKVAEAFSFSESYIPLIGDNCYNFFHFNIEQDLANLNELKKYINESDFHEPTVMQIDDQYIVAVNPNSKLIFDVGNLGMKYNPGHGHSDILSFNYAFNGNPIFVDPGTKRYSNDKDCLELKKSISHNTIYVDGRDHAFLWGFFRWAYLPKAPKYSVKSDGKFVNLIAEIENKVNNKTISQKRNISIFDNGFKIIDEFFAENESLANVLILHDSVEPELADNGLILNNGKNKFSLSFNSETKFDLEVIPQFIFPGYDYEIKSHKILARLYCPGKIEFEMIFNLIS